MTAPGWGRAREWRGSGRRAGSGRGPGRRAVPPGPPGAAERAARREMHMTRRPSCAGTAAAHGAGARAQAAPLPEQGQAPRTGKVKSGSGRRAPAGEGNRPNAHSRGSHLCAGAGRRQRQACAGRRSQDCGAAPPPAAGGASGPRGGGSGCCRMAGPGARGRAGKSRPPAAARRCRSPRCRRRAAPGLGDGSRLRGGAGRVVFVVSAALPGVPAG